MKLKVDLHVHTTKSRDGFTTPEQIVPAAKRTGLDGVAITDHNELSTQLLDGLLFIRGMEVTSNRGHILALGIKEPIERGLSPEETIKLIRDGGGLAILPHPYDLFRSSIRPETLKLMPDAIEVINSASLLSGITWPRAIEFARTRGIPQVAGSDSHIPQTVGKAFTIIESETVDESSLLDSIRAGRSTPSGSLVGMGDRFRKLVLHTKKRF